MKFILLVFCFFISSLTFSAFSGDSDSKEGDDSFMDSLMQEEDVNCDNIVTVLQSYINLSETNNGLLGVSANRFSHAVSSDKTDEQMKMLEEEISRSAQLIQDNQFILSDRAFLIMDVLPDCLKK